MLKRLFFGAVAAGFCLAAPALSGPLTSGENEIVTTIAAASVLSAQCPSLQIAAGPAFLYYSAQRGVDFEKISAAVINVLLAAAKQPYDSSKIIPEVTVQTVDTVRTIYDALQIDRSGQCKKMGDMLLEAGILQRK